MIDQEIERRVADFCELGIPEYVRREGAIHLVDRMVYLHLRRCYSGVFYYLTRAARQEVDFLVVDTRGKPTLAVQVCQSLADRHTLDRELKPLVATAKYFEIDQAIIVTMSEERLIKDDGCTIRVVPAWKWLLEAKGAE